MASKPDGCSRRHWVSPFFTKAELDHDFYIRLSFSSRVFNLDCRFDPMVHLSCKAKQFLELMVPKEAMSWVGSMAS